MTRTTIGPNAEVSASGSLNRNNYPGHSFRSIFNLLTSEEIERFNSLVYSLQTKVRSFNKSLSLESLLLETKSPRTSQNTEIPKLCSHGGKTCGQNCARGFIKTFTMTFAVKYMAGVLPALLTGKIIKRPQLLKELAGRDTAEFALFLAAFTSSYNGILCALRRYRNTESRSNSFMAGSLAGLTLFFDRSKTRRQSIMIYLLIRALQFNASYLMKKWAIKRQQNHPGETKWDDRLANFMSRYAGVAIMSLTSGQLIYSLLFHPDALQKSYGSFLSEHAGFKTAFGNKYFSMLEAYGPTVHRMNSNHSPVTIPTGYTSRQYIAQHVSKELATSIPATHHHKYVNCALFHPLHDNCVIDKFSFFQKGMLRTLKVYAPLYLIMLVLFKSKQLITKYEPIVFADKGYKLINLNSPTKAIQRLATSSLRSSLFLTMYVFAALSTSCSLKRLTGNDQPWMYFVLGAVGGSMLIIETPGRHMENALYCLARSFEALWGTALKKGYVKNVPHGEILLFMLSMGLIMPVYQNDKDAIGSTYLSILTRLFGEN